MKRVVYGCLVLFVLTCLSFPAWAQKGVHKKEGKSHVAAAATHSKKSTHKASMSAERSNKGGAARGKARAEEVQSENTGKRSSKAAAVVSHTAGKAAGKAKGSKGKSSAHGHK